MALRGMFEERYQQLERRMAAQAKSGGEIFLPNPQSAGPVDFVLVCMEPSLGRWAPTPEVAVDRIAQGFRNFIDSVEDFILHFCADQYLCDQPQEYFVTDVSKGAMFVDRAAVERVERYNRWHDLLTDEIELVLRAAGRVIAVGNAVAKHFRDRGMRDFSLVMHYSGQGAAGRNAAIVGRETGFEAYRDSVSLRDVVDNAKQYLLSCQVPADIRAESLARVSKSDLSDSRCKLMFIYKTAFEGIRLRRGKVHPLENRPNRVGTGDERNDP